MRDSLAAEARQMPSAAQATPAEQETSATAATEATAATTAGKSSSSQATSAFSGGVGALTYFKRNSLAAEAQRVATGETAQPGGEPATTTATSAASAASAGNPSLPAQAGSSAAERETNDSDLMRDSLAAEAQRTVPVPTFAQLAAAGATMATGYFGLAGIGRGNSGSGALEQEAALAAAGQLSGEPVLSGADPQLAATGAESGAIVPASAGAAEQQGIPVPAGGTETGAGAEGFVATPVAGSASQSTPATAAAREGAQAEQVSAALPGAGETHSPHPGSQLGGVSVRLQETGEQQEKGAAEGVPKETAASGALGEAPASAGSEAGRQSAQSDSAQPDAAPVVGFGARLAERREARSQTARGEGAETVVPEQAGSTQKALGEEGLGIKTATASQAAKPASLHGASGQYGAAEPAGSGAAEAKPTGVEAGPAQAAALGTQGPAAEATQHAEAKPGHPRGALHESVLAQVKDGVVTHDGKGNGQMSIRLNPGELGELKIQVRMEDNRLRVEVQADNRMVKDLLMSNLDSLKEALSGKNFTMEGFDVSTGGFNSPLSEERGNPRQQPAFRPTRAGGYGAEDERRVNYLTADASSLLDVRF